MDAPTTAIDGIERYRDHGYPFAIETIQRALRRLAHDHAPGRDGETIDRERVILGGELDDLEPLGLEPLDQKEGRACRIDQDGCNIDHHQKTVDVLPVAREMDADQLDARDPQHLLELPDPLIVHPRAQSDDDLLRVEPGEASTLENRPTMDGAQNRHSDPGELARGGQLLAAAIGRSETGNDPAPFDSS